MYANNIENKFLSIMAFLSGCFPIALIHFVRVTVIPYWGRANDINCYMIGMNGRNLLGLNDIARENSLKNKKRLIQEGIVSKTSENSIESYMKKPGKAQCLSEVDESLMQIFAHVTRDNKELISKKYRLKITQDANDEFHIATSNEEEIEDLVATLTNKRGKNFEDETVETKSPFVKI